MILLTITWAVMAAVVFSRILHCVDRFFTAINYYVELSLQFYRASQTGKNLQKDSIGYIANKLF